MPSDGCMAKPISASNWDRSCGIKPATSDPDVLPEREEAPLCTAAVMNWNGGTMFAIDTNGRNDAQPKVASQRSAATPAGRPSALSDLPQDPIGFGLGFVRRHLIAIAICGLLGLGLGIGLAMLAPNRYGSTAQLLIDPRDLRVLQNEIAPQAVGSDVTTAYLESQARVIASDSIKRRVIDRLDLAMDPDFGGRRPGLAERLGLSAGPSGPQRDPVLTALDVMDKQVMVRRGERTFVIDITAISSEGPKSARIANAMAEAYLDDQSIVRSESATRASTSLTARLSELRERVRLAEDKVEKYRAANNLVGASGKLVTEEQLAVSNMQLTQARARLADAQAKFDQVRIVRPTSIEAGATPEALSSSSIAALRAQLGTALTREADALVLYGAQHPQLLSAQAQVRDSRRQIAEELARTVQAARAELDRARASEASLNAQVERLKRDTLTTGQAAVQLRELEREADANRQVYQAFLLRARETGEQSSVDSTNARIITSAVVPRDKLGPNRKLFAALGLVAGLILGVMAGLLRDLVPARRGPVAAPVAAAEASDAKAGIRMAAMPREPAASAAAPASAAPQPRGTGRWRGLAGAAKAAPAPAATDGGPMMVSLPAIRALANWRKQPAPERSAFHGSGFSTDAWDQPTSLLAQAIHAVRDRLALEEVPGSNRKVVVLGLVPGAGTSLVALNLALAAAREKATPLLIDLAGGPASLSAAFAPDAELGAEEVISGSAGLIRAALQDDETGVFFLSRPARVTRPATPSITSLSGNLLDQTRRFEAVIIDAGSIADGALPYMLAELADDLVVVAPASMSGEASNRLLQRALGPDAAKVRSVVQNVEARA